MSEPTLLRQQREVLQRFRQATQQRDQQEYTAEAHLNTKRAEADEKLKQKQLITVVRRIKAIKEQEAQYTSEKKSANEAWESVRSQADSCLGRVQTAKQSLQTILQKADLESTITQSTSLPLPKTEDRLGYYSLQSNQASTKSPPSSLSSTHNPSTELKNAAINAEQELARFTENVKALLAVRQARIIRRNRFILASVILVIIFGVYSCNNYIDRQALVRIQATAVAVTIKTQATATAVAAIYKPIEDLVGMKFVMVPEGEFLMGSPDDEGDDDEHPQHPVKLGAFMIGVTEVTNAQYRPFVEAGGYRNSTFWSDDGWKWRTENSIIEPGCWGDKNLNQPDLPVVCINWYEADAYSSWLRAETRLNIRLPTEAEWEKAARGRYGSVYPWGSEFDSKRLNYCDSNCDSGWKDANVNDNFIMTAPVGSFPIGASPYGALDMAGNVWEWTYDWYDKAYYANSPSIEPFSSTGTNFVVRGGSWYESADGVRSANRSSAPLETANPLLGFRLVRYVGFNK